MGKIESIVEELKRLPPVKLAQAADYIHRLRAVSESERETILQRTAGCLTPEEGEELERIIEDGCEKIDAGEW